MLQHVGIISRCPVDLVSSTTVWLITIRTILVFFNGFGAFNKSLILEVPSPEEKPTHFSISQFPNLSSLPTQKSSIRVAG